MSTLSTVPFNEARRRVLIADTEFTGHHLVFIRLLVDAWTATGGQAVLALPPSIEQTPEWNLHLAGASTQFTLGPEIRSLTVRNLRKLAGGTQADLLVLPNGDRGLAGIALCAPFGIGISVRGLIMADPRSERPKSLVRRLKLFTKRVLLARANRMKSVRCFWLCSPADWSQAEEYHVPDPVILDGIDTRTPLLDRLERLPPKYWFAMVGVIDRWKNPLTVVQAMQNICRDGTHDFGVMVCGSVREDIAPELFASLRQLEESGIDVFALDRTLSNEEMNQVVRRADAVVLAYSTHATTSTLGKAAALGTQIVAVGSGAFQKHATAVQQEALTGRLDRGTLERLLVTAVTLASPQPRQLAGPAEFANRLLGLREAD